MDFCNSLNLDFLSLPLCVRYISLSLLPFRRVVRLRRHIRRLRCAFTSPSAASARVPRRSRGGAGGGGGRQAHRHPSVRVAAGGGPGAPAAAAHGGPHSRACHLRWAREAGVGYARQGGYATLG